MSEMVKQLSEDCDSTNVEPRWFAAYTASHHEKHVLEQLGDRGVESFLPLYTESRHWNKRKPVDLSLPLFPNYVFIRIFRGQRTTVLNTPGVFSIVGSSLDPWALPDREIEAIRDGLQERHVQPHPYLSVGERARVKSGVLAGLEGVVVREKQNLRMVLSLDHIMRSIAIEVDAGELESIAAKSDQPFKLSAAGGRAKSSVKRLR